MFVFIVPFCFFDNSRVFSFSFFLSIFFLAFIVTRDGLGGFRLYDERKERLNKGREEKGRKEQKGKEETMKR